MTIRDWLYLGITIASYVIAIIAGVYARNKAKINKATTAGKALDVVGQLATYAVHEAEHTGMENEQKREFASQVIVQGLNYLGIKNVTANVINGAIEKAVNVMHLANMEDNDEITVAPVPDNEILKPTDQLTAPENQPQGDVNNG